MLKSFAASLMVTFSLMVKCPLRVTLPACVPEVLFWGTTGKLCVARVGYQRFANTLLVHCGSSNFSRCSNYKGRFVLFKESVRLNFCVVFSFYSHSLQTVSDGSANGLVVSLRHGF